MENENPLKNWVRKHSPLRPKPLPRPPANDGARPPRPLDPISGNMSPSRRPSKNRLRSLLKSKQHPLDTFDIVPSERVEDKKQLRRQSMPLMAPPVEHHTTLRKSRHQPSQSTDFHRLSAKISTLEAQLQEAKEELGYAARYNSDPVWPQPPSNQQSSIRQVQVDQSHPSLNLPDVEFVHDLLIERERDFSARGLTSKSSTDLSYDSKPLELYELPDYTSHDLSGESPNQHKRKRSQLRQQSWEQVQSQLQERQSRCIRQQPPDSKRPRKDQGRSQSTRRPQSKDLPELPQFPVPNAAKDSHPNFFAIVDPAEDDAEEQNPYPPLDRHQRHFSQPPPLPASPDKANQQKPTKHRRSKSQIIDAVELRQTLGPSQSENWVSESSPDRPPSRKGGGSSPASRPVNPPSPSRRHCPSPIKLERVQEEYEWDEDIF